MRIRITYRRDLAQGGFFGLGILGSIALGATAIGSGVSAIGAISSAQAQSKAADFNAAVASNNAGAAAQKAKFDATQIADQTRRATAQQRAAMASSGFDPNTGTFADVTADTKRQGEMNRLARIYQGRLGVNQSISQAQLSTMQASADETAGLFGAGSSILGGISQATSIASNPAFRSATSTTGAVG